MVKASEPLEARAGVRDLHLEGEPAGCASYFSAASVVSAPERR